MRVRARDVRVRTVVSGYVCVHLWVMCACVCVRKCTYVGSARTCCDVCYGVWCLVLRCVLWYCCGVLGCCYSILRHNADRRKSTGVNVLQYYGHTGVAPWVREIGTPTLPHTHNNPPGFNTSATVTEYIQQTYYLSQQQKCGLVVSALSVFSLFWFCCVYFNLLSVIWAVGAMIWWLVRFVIKCKQTRTHEQTIYKNKTVQHYKRDSHILPFPLLYPFSTTSYFSL